MTSCTPYMDACTHLSWVSWGVGPWRHVVTLFSVLGNSAERQAFPEPLSVSLCLTLWGSRDATCNFHPGLHVAKPRQHSPVLPRTKFPSMQEHKSQLTRVSTSVAKGTGQWVLFDFLIHEGSREGASV